MYTIFLDPAFSNHASMKRYSKEYSSLNERNFRRDGEKSMLHLHETEKGILFRSNQSVNEENLLFIYRDR